MRKIGVLAGILVTVALGAALAVGAQLATRKPELDSRWVVAVGSDSFVVLDGGGAPESVCTVAVGETYCYPVRPSSDLTRQPIDRQPPPPRDAENLAGDALAV